MGTSPMRKPSEGKPPGGWLPMGNWVELGDAEDIATMIWVFLSLSMWLCYCNNVCHYFNGNVALFANAEQG